MLKQSTIDKSVHNAEDIFENAQLAASGALDRVTQALDQGVERARKANVQMNESAHRAGMLTSSVIRHDPIKSVLIAAATGAALMGLISLLTRTQNRH